MAKKKTSGKAKGGRLKADAKSEPPPAKPVDAMKVDKELEDLLEGYVDWKSPYRKQKERIAELEHQLAGERAKLELMAAPLREAMESMNAARLKAAAATQPYDAGLKAAVAKVRTKINTHTWDSKARRYKTKASGAKPWKELQRDGATDEQIKRNLKSVESGWTSSRQDGDDYLDPTGALMRWRYRGQDQVILAASKVVGEVRRVFGIPQPVNKTKGVVHKKGGAAKKPATKAKSSTPAKTSGKLSPAVRKKAQAATKKSSKPAKKKTGSTNGKLHAPRNPRTGKAINAKEFPRLTSRNLLLWSAAGYRVDAKELVAAMTPEEKDLWQKRHIPDYPCDSEDPRLLIAEYVEVFLVNRHAEAEAKTQANGKASTNGKHAPTNRIAKHFDEQFTDPTKPAPTSSPPELKGVTAGAMPRPEAVGDDLAKQRSDAIASCKAMEGALLAEIFAAYPATKTKAQITAAAGYQPGGKVSAAFKSLWRAGYIDEIGRSTVKASAAYFDAEPVGAAE